MKVILSADADSDLERLGDHIAADNPARAVTFIRELRSRCAALATMPERFPLVPRYQDRGVRRAVHGDYLIFYTVTAEAIVILHVLHGHMDYSTLLFPEG